MIQTRAVSRSRKRPLYRPQTVEALKVLLMFCFDTAGFVLIQLFLQTSDSYSTDDPTSKLFHNFDLLGPERANTGTPNQNLSADIKSAT